MLPGAPFKSGLPTAAINMQFGSISGAICLACGESAPTITYSYPSGLIVQVHDACEALWREEQERPTPRPP